MEMAEAYISNVDTGCTLSWCCCIPVARGPGLEGRKLEKWADSYVLLAYSVSASDGLCRPRLCTDIAKQVGIRR